MFGSYLECLSFFSPWNAFKQKPRSEMLSSADFPAVGIYMSSLFSTSAFFNCENAYIINNTCCISGMCYWSKHDQTCLLCRIRRQSWRNFRTPASVGPSNSGTAIKSTERPKSMACLVTWPWKNKPAWQFLKISLACEFLLSMSRKQCLGTFGYCASHLKSDKYWGVGFRPSQDESFLWNFENCSAVKIWPLSRRMLWGCSRGSREWRRVKGIILNGFWIATCIDFFSNSGLSSKVRVLGRANATIVLSRLVVRSFDSNIERPKVRF